MHSKGAEAVTEETEVVNEEALQQQGHKSTLLPGELVSHHSCGSLC